MKTCTKCEETKPADKFPKGRNECQACRTAYTRIQRTKNREAYRETRLKYEENNKPHIRSVHRKWKENNPHYARNYYENNKDRIMDRSRSYYKDNRARVLKKVKEWQKKNSDKVAENFRKWRKENPDKDRQRGQRRRARKSDLPATLTAEQWEWLCEQTDQRCIYCGEQSETLAQEHIVPVVQGGGYTLENIRGACQSCNSRKGGRTPEQANMPLIEEYEDRIQAGLSWKQEELF